MLKDFFNFLFPLYCPLCTVSLVQSSPSSLSASHNDNFCRTCLHEVTFLQDPSCTKCSMPFLGATDNHLCEDCLKEEPSYVIHKSIFHYKGLIRDAQLNYKFNNIFYSTPALADYLSNYAFSIMEENKIFFDYALGVPIHKNRLQMRTFNQSTLLAKKVSKTIGIKFTPDLIIKTKDTLPQTRLKARERRENIKNAFTLNEGILNQKKGFDLKGKNILLIDDIYTTGSTINECSKVLTKAGANVYALTLARSLIL